MRDSTAQLTSVIAKMSVRGTALAPEQRPGTDPERSAASQALSRLRGSLTKPAPGEARRPRSAQDLNRADSNDSLRASDGGENLSKTCASSPQTNTATLEPRTDKT